MTPDDAELLVVDDEPFLREAVAARCGSSVSR